MNRLFLSVILTAVFIPCAAFAEQVVSLKDGSQIKGELVGVTSGVYTIKTVSMGEVNVEASKVASISNASLAASPTTAGTSSSSAGNMNQKIETAQAALMNNPAMMADIQDLMKDPQFMEIVSDPAFSKAALSHDTAALEANPKTQQLMNNPKMRALIEKMQQGN